MKSRLRALMARPFGRYVVVGVSVYLFEVLVIVVAQAWGASALLAVALSFWLGLVTSFLLQKLFTFRDRRLHRRILTAQLVAVTLLVLVNFGFTLLVVHWLSGVVPAFVARTGALGITTIWNFYLYKIRIFKPSDELVY